MANEQEAYWIEQVLSGDSAAFRHLVDRHKQMVFSICFRILLQKEEAEEAAQDVFIKAFQKLNSFKKESKLSTWLYRIAFNEAISRKRKKGAPVQYMEEVPAEYENVMDSEWDSAKHKVQAEYIEKACAALNETDQLIIKLYHLEEFSISEVVDITGLKASAVKVRLLRARKKLYFELYKLLKQEAEELI